jgi:hypothetical protein
VAISYIGSSALAYAAANSVTVTLPSHNEDDLLIFVAGNREDDPVPSIVTAPSGYTQQGSVHAYDAGQLGIAIAVFYKVAGASESNPTVEWNTGAARGVYGVVHVYRGVDTSTPIDASAGGGTLADATTCTPTGTLTTQTDGAMAISVVMQDDDTTLSLDTPQSFAIDQQSNTTSGSDWTQGIASRTVATAGGVTLPTWGGGNDAWCFESFALKPAGLTHYTLDATDSQSFAVTGTAATFGLSMPAATESFALTGTAVDLDHDKRQDATTVQTFAVTGTAATPKHDKKIDAAADSYALTGFAATFDLGMPAVAGSYAVTGTAAATKHDRVLPANLPDQTNLIHA